VEGFDQVGIALQTYCKALITQPERRLNSGGTLRASIKQRIAVAQRLYRSGDQGSFYSILNFKSPGPDRFKSGFYKATWQKLGPLVCAAVKEFFSKGNMPSYISETRPTVLPKVPHPQSV